MRKLATIALAGMLALSPVVALTSCSGWKTVTSGGIVIDEVERDEKGYIVEEAARQAAFEMAEVMEAEVTLVECKLDESSDPVQWVVDFDANGTSYHYVVNAENGDLIDFSSLGLGL